MSNDNEFKWYIMVLDRGFVYVGKARISTELVYHWEWQTRVCIRRWGTSKGLAELCDGPTDNTALDTEHRAMTPFRGVLDIIHITPKGAEKWSEKIRG